ncbi:Ionotropic receptor 222 [Frankliniella occidentalis]|nr:Ionotropic receptor 222 [Frankliniella occidentalis]
MQLLLGLVGFLCCSAGERAAAALLVTHTSPPEVRCMAALLAALLPPYNATLLVTGDVGPIAPYLHELAPGTPRVVNRTPPADPRIRNQMSRGRILVLVVQPTAAELLEYMLKDAIRGPVLTLMWTWAPTPQDVLGFASEEPLWLCHVPLILAVALPDGTTSLHAGVPEGCLATWPSLNMPQVDTCSAGSWRRGPPIPRMCTRWTPPSSPPPHIVYAEKSSPGLNKNFDDFHRDTISTIRPRVRIQWVRGKSLRDVTLNMFYCNLSGLTIIEPMPLSTAAHHISSEWVVWTPVLVAVPAGRGPRATLLQAVTAEFSAELWIALAAAFLAMTLALAAASACLGRPRLAALAVALLQTLAPLLGQSPHGRPAHRPLSAVWLLMSVVLAAAYQGLLLREITAPPTDINSLEQLAQSGLEVHVSENLPIGSSAADFAVLRKDRIHYIPRHRVRDVLRRVLDAQDAALICDLTFSMASRIVDLPLKERQRLHLFTLSAAHLRSYAAASTGSPLQRRLRTLYSRVQASFSPGTAEGAGLTASSLRHSAPCRTRPLSLAHLLPAFVLLAVGHCVLSALAFALEVLCHRFSVGARRAPRQPLRRVAWE